MQVQGLIGVDALPALQRPLADQREAQLWREYADSRPCRARSSALAPAPGRRAAAGLARAVAFDMRTFAHPGGHLGQPRQQTCRALVPPIGSGRRRIFTLARDEVFRQDLCARCILHGPSTASVAQSSVLGPRYEPVPIANREPRRFDRGVGSWSRGSRWTGLQPGNSGGRDPVGVPRSGARSCQPTPGTMAAPGSLDGVAGSVSVLAMRQGSPPPAARQANHRRRTSSSVARGKPAARPTTARALQVEGAGGGRAPAQQ